MHILIRLKNLPGPLMFMLLAFFCVPWLSLGYLPAPQNLFHQYAFLEALLLLITYWILPISVVVTVLLQSFTALIFLLLEAFFLLVTGLLNLELLASNIQWIRFAAIIVMALLGWIVINQDLLYPFLTDSHRYWRRYRRIYGNRMLTLLGEGTSNYKVMLNDVSLTGMGLTVPREAGTYLAILKAGDDLEFEIKERELACVIKAKLVWKKSIGPVIQVGVAVNDKPLMEKVQASIKYLAQASPLQSAMNRAWAKSYLRHSAYAIWAVSLLLTFCLPIISQQLNARPPEARFSDGAP